MDIAEKREEIAGCIVNLKKGLKKIRREDIDAAIVLLVKYDQDLKRLAKLPIAPIEKATKIKYETDHTLVNTDRSVEVETLPITVMVINGDNGSWAYPINGTVEETVADVNEGIIKPLAKVQVDKWMKEHRSDEIPFMSIYATVVSGRIITKQEEILAVGQEACIGDDRAKVFKIIELNENTARLERGWRSILPIKKSKLVPIHKTEVKYFIIDKWEP